jgi:hypothetical protein
MKIKKLQTKSNISNNNKNIVYVINNNPSKQRRQHKRKASMMPTESTSGSTDNPSSSQIRLPDNRFLNSSNLAIENQRANLQLLENPQLRINQPNVPLLENNYEQRLLQIQDGLNQQQENTIRALNYLYNRFDSKPRIDEPVNEDDNYGNFAGTEGSDFFVSEGEDRPDYKDINNVPTPVVQSQSSINEINTTPLTSAQSYQPEDENISVRKSVKRLPPKQHLVFNSPPPRFGIAKDTLTNNPPPQEKSPYINFDDIPIEEPNYAKAPVKKEKPIGVRNQQKIDLREQYIKLGGTNNSVLNSPLAHLSITNMRNYIDAQQRINDSRQQYQFNGGKDPAIINSNSIKDIKEAINDLIKQNNSRKKA